MLACSRGQGKKKKINIHFSSKVSFRSTSKSRIVTLFLVACPTGEAMVGYIHGVVAEWIN
jgi:hypothetical protein